jgi:hypothetical protein
VRVRGTQTLQLARQLIAAALNCIVTGINAGDPTPSADCSEASIAALFADCNKACVGDPTATRTVGDCISQIDCFNNGGTFSSQTGCTPGGDNSCHNQALPLDDIAGLPNNDPASGKCFGQQGPAGSPDECNAARSSTCEVIGSNESSCATDSAP